MRVILAEKPSVGREVAIVLGIKKSNNEYIELSNGDVVTWAIGHLVSLAQPEEYNQDYKKWSLDHLPIVPEEYMLTVVKNTSSQFKTIKNLLKTASDVVIATDAGREGELIARWILKKCSYKGNIQRLWISSLTTDSIKRGFDNLQQGEKYDPLYAAAEQRAIADWVIGMNATRAYTVKTNTLLTIGRVQTPTLALVVKREHEINSFQSRPFWELIATFKKGSETYEGKYFWGKGKDQQTRFSAIEGGNKIILDIASQTTAVVQEVDQKIETKSQPSFFDLTALQKVANKLLGLTADQTLKALQSLYEAKYVTYPRTDSSYLTEDVAETLPDILDKLKSTLWGVHIPTNVPSLINNKRYTNSNKVTDHHAIIPTGVIPGTLPELQQNIYDLIVSHFIAAHLAEGKDSKTEIVTVVSGYNFISKGTTVIEEGWRALFKEVDPDEIQDENKSLPQLIQGESVDHSNTRLKEGKTQPPKRYTEGTLLAAMETAGKDIEDQEQREIMKETGGLGTPATRSSIIEGLKKREYITLRKKSICPSEKGISLIQLLGDHPLTSPDLTGEWESLLKNIEKGEYKAAEFQRGIERFSNDIIDQARDKELEVIFEKKDAVLGQCPHCNSDILEKKSFYGCSKYSEGCKFSISKRILDKNISVTQVKNILDNGKTNLIKGFKGKKGNFDAVLTYDISAGKLNFVFPPKK